MEIMKLLVIEMHDTLHRGHTFTAFSLAIDHPKQLSEILSIIVLLITSFLGIGLFCSRTPYMFALNIFHA
jgi:hypothetical protein